MITNYFEFCKIKEQHTINSKHALCDVVNETGVDENVKAGNPNKKISEARKEVNYSNEVFRQKYETELEAQKYMLENYKKELVDLIHKKFEEKTGCIVQPNNSFKLVNNLFYGPTKAMNINHTHEVPYSRDKDINKVCFDKFHKSFLNHLEIFGQGANTNKSRVESLRESVLESINELFNNAIKIVIEEKNKNVSVVSND